METYFLIGNNELKGFVKQETTSQKILLERIFLFKPDMPGIS